MGLFTLGSSPAHRTVPAAGCLWPKQSCSSPENPYQRGFMGQNRGKDGTESSCSGFPLRAFLPLPARRESRCQQQQHQQQPCKRIVTVLSGGSWSPHQRLSLQKAEMGWIPSHSSLCHYEVMKSRGISKYTHMPFKTYGRVGQIKLQLNVSA